MVCDMQPLILESIELEHFTVSGFDTGCHASDPEGQVLVFFTRGEDGRPIVCHVSRSQGETVS